MSAHQGAGRTGRVAAWRAARTASGPVGGLVRQGIALTAPLALLCAILAIQLASTHWTILELTVLAPLLAATLSGPVLTGAYVMLAILGSTLVGSVDGLFTVQDGGLPAQMVRLTGILLGGVMAVLVSRYNTRRETKLQNVTRVAEVAQRAVLPLAPTVSGDLRLAVRYESAATDAMVGGDLYEVVDSPWGTRLLVGDVRGKGLDAVRIASHVLGCFRLVAKHRAGLVSVLADLDEEVADVSGLDDFVTAIAVQIRDGRLDMVNAGHPDPLLVRAGTARALSPHGRSSPLGLLAGDIDITSFTLQAGDRVLLYTDGIAEARHSESRAFFPLASAVTETLSQDRPLGDCLDDLVRRVQRWTRSALGDDVALLAVELPAPAPRHRPAPAARSDPIAAGGSGPDPAPRPADHTRT
ncbi:PP2C family protein-serine/threonine phosphatase [Parafrankia colletiae]|uniref:PP2C family protein-serine/threonine phosphatase n=1 Tax=Parafrankia colletiae TaxID=573497 RepID=UPI000AD4AD9F